MIINLRSQEGDGSARTGNIFDMHEYTISDFPTKDLFDDNHIEVPSNLNRVSGYIRRGQTLEHLRGLSVPVNALGAQTWPRRT